MSTEVVTVSGVIPRRTGAALGRAFLLYLVGAVAVVTLLPFDFRRPDRLAVFWSGELPDAVANVVMFLPLGFLFRLTWPAPADRHALRPLLFGAGLSFLLESAQLFLASRYTSPADVLANGAGAWLGALAHDAVARRLRLTPALASRLALELPLMGLVYLLVPLLWINALASFGRPGPPFPTLLIGLVGAIALGQVYRHRFGPDRTISAGRYALVGGGWFLAGGFVLFAARPFAGVTGTLAVMLIVLGWSGLRVGPGERRYETGTLYLLAPLFALYLATLSGWPRWPRVAPATTASATILATLELLAAFTVLGYGLAEHQGRRERPFSRVAPLVGAIGGLAALALAIPAAGHSTHADALARVLASALAAMYGAAIYHLQRAHIRQLLRSR